MAKRREIRVEARSTAPRGALYGLLVDSSSWPAWSPIESVELEREGDPPPDGVGAIRRNTRGRVVGRDEITELVDGERFAYRSLSGLPVRDYRAAVELSDVEGGTLIVWSAGFEPKLPGSGPLLVRGLRGFLGECAEGLAGALAGDSATRL
ncbi:SRPBCC family protein [Thermoleophilia bacterium SCSIO 60948]|nr:SRPBCC family protein [Thermoleophilia bacterium SCSIO 60948]